MAAVQHRHDGSQVTFQFVIDGKRESISQRAMQPAVGLGMNAGIQGQCVNVCVKAVEEIVANAGLLPLIEHVPFQEVGFRRPRNPHLSHVSPL